MREKWWKKMLRKAKELCELQGIPFKVELEVTVICPRCEAKKFVINKTGAGKCRSCQHEADIMEVIDIAQEEWQDQHRESINLMTKRGD